MNLALERLLYVARRQVALHVAEDPSGSNNVKYNTAYYGKKVHRKPTDPPRDYAWCVVFQWWCFQRAGIPTTIFPASASVLNTTTWFQHRDRFAHTPHVGSLVIFKKRHIGLVEKVLKHGGIQTIEGNTDGNGSATGGRVMRKTHTANDGILGFCNPDYKRAEAYLRKHGAPPLPGAKHTSAKAAVRPSAPPAVALPARTVVHAANVRLAAGQSRYVQFTSASVNTAGFWQAPVGSRRGYNMLTGPGAYVGDVTVTAPSPLGDNEIEFGLVQSDPGHDFQVVRRLPTGRLAGGGGAGHTTALSMLDPGHHVWLAVRSERDVVLPSVSVELVLLSR